jgi:hypothetical protein
VQPPASDHNFAHVWCVCAKLGWLQTHLLLRSHAALSSSWSRQVTVATKITKQHTHSYYPTPGLSVTNPSARGHARLPDRHVRQQLSVCVFTPDKPTEAEHLLFHMPRRLQWSCATGALLQYTVLLDVLALAGKQLLCNQSKYYNNITNHALYLPEQTRSTCSWQGNASVVQSRHVNRPFLLQVLVIMTNPK